MPQLLWMAVAAVIVVAGLAVIQFATVLVRLMQLRVSPIRVTALDDSPALSSHEAAAVAELEGLGFVERRWSELELGPRRFKSVLLRHRTEPAFAELTFTIGGALAGYALAFHTFLVDGTRLTTCNRADWLFPGRRAGVEAADAFADDVDGHWRAHLERPAGSDPRAMEIGDAQRAMKESNESYFDWLRESGAISQHREAWHFTLRAAQRMARAWFTVRRKLARPYRSAASSGEHEAPFFADFYLAMEQAGEGASRRDVKLWVLGLSAALSFAGWGLLAGWTQALALIAIIFVHESGHALAMRAFGYRHMHMFFIPFIGAVVTGAPREMRAWRQSIILLAGPLPGLLAGVAALIYPGSLPDPSIGFDWEVVAVMAVWINLFNLLPIMPLDGGQLMELALFRRWPRARLAFVLLSAAAFIALAIWIGDTFVWMLALLMLWAARSQWRVARLLQQWREGVPVEQQLAPLFAFTRTGLKQASFTGRYMLVKSVVALQRVHRARAWESAAVVLVMAGLWMSVVLVAREQPAAPVVVSEQVERSPAQIGFDDVYWDYLDGEPEDRAAALGVVKARAAALDRTDPRLIDLEVEEAVLLGDDAYRARLEALARAGRDGISWSVASMVDRLLRDAIVASVKEAPAARAERLRREVDRLMRLAPGAFDGTVEARLWIAEAQDRAGESAAAEAALAAVEGATRGTYWRQKVLEARAWFHITHDGPAEAVAVLEHASWAGDIPDPRNPVAPAYAWALLLAGRSAEGLEQMQRVAHPLAAQRPTLWLRLRGVRAHSMPTLEPVALAYALRQNGHAAEAKALIAREEWHCWGIDATDLSEPVMEPWQGVRGRLEKETLRALCPPRPKCES